MKKNVEKTYPPNPLPYKQDCFILYNHLGVRSVGSVGRGGSVGSISPLSLLENIKDVIEFDLECMEESVWGELS